MPSVISTIALPPLKQYRCEFFHVDEDGFCVPHHEGISPPTFGIEEMRELLLLAGKQAARKKKAFARLIICREAPKPAPGEEMEMKLQ